MKKYYQLTDDYELDYGITKSPPMPDGVFTGESIDVNSLPPLNFEINVPDDESCTHYMTEETVIVSDVFVKLLQKISVDNFQVFPVKLKKVPPMRITHALLFQAMLF